MGVSIFLMFEPSLPEATHFSNGTDGKCLAAATPLLDVLCDQLGLRPFTDYFPDFDELAELALADSEDLAEVETMFEPDEALANTKLLLQAMNNDTQVFKEWSPREIEGVKGSLQLLRKDWEVASSMNARFCLSFS